MDGEYDNAEMIKMQLQQFLHEWHYRVLNSNLALSTDRHAMLDVALQLLEMHGSAQNLCGTGGAKKEEELIEEVLGQMSTEGRKSFVHFSQQLKLVIAAVTRVRHAIDPALEEDTEDAKKAVVQVMEEGDVGINSMIMRQAVVESAVEIGELNQLHNSWVRPMGKTLAELLLSAEKAEKAEQELEIIEAQVLSFGQEQNEKSRKVLASISGNSDKESVKMCFKDWVAHYRQYLADKEFHDKFQKQLDDCREKLVEFKMANKASSSKMMLGQGKAKDDALKDETFKAWMKDVADEKKARELEEEVRRANEAMEKFKAAQSENTKKVMERMTGANDASLKAMCFQAWAKDVADVKKENAMAAAVAAQQKALEEHLEKASAEARQVVSRMFGSGDKGLLMMVRQMWNDLYVQEKKEMEADEAMQRANADFSKLSASRKKTIKSVADRTNSWEQELILYKIFNDWKTQAKFDKLYEHYMHKMETKNNQLGAVQNMFKQFANQLESGISTTPRSGKKSSNSSKPPIAPA